MRAVTYPQEEQAVTQDETSHPQDQGRSQKKEGELHKRGHMRSFLRWETKPGQKKAHMCSEAQSNDVTEKPPSSHWWRYPLICPSQQWWEEQETMVYT